MLSGIPLGHLADRRGPREVQVLLIIGMAICTLAKVWIATFWQFALVTIVNQMLDRGVAGVAGGLIAGSLEGNHRIRARAYSRTAMAIGLTIGSGLAAVPLHFGTPTAYRTALVIDTLTFAAAGLTYLRLPRVPPKNPAQANSPLAALRDTRYVLMTGLFAALFLYAPVLSFAIPLWVVQRTTIAPTTLSALYAINTTCFVLLQIPVSRRIETVEAGIRAVGAAGVLLFAGCGCYAGTAYLPGPGAFTLLVCGVVTQACAGVLASSAQFCLSFQLAPDDAQGQYQGLVSTGTALSSAVGPTVLTLLVLRLGPPGWLLFGAVLVAAASMLAPTAGAMHRLRQQPR